MHQNAEDLSDIFSASAEVRKMSEVNDGDGRGDAAVVIAHYNRRKREKVVAGDLSACVMPLDKPSEAMRGATALRDRSNANLLTGDGTG
jgi:hypothetical protein